MTVVSSLFDDLENVERAVTGLRGERVAGLIGESGHVDHGQRIGAFEHQGAADRNGAQRLLGAQHRLRAAQAAQVEHGLAVAAHGLLPSFDHAAPSSFAVMTYLKLSASRLSSCTPAVSPCGYIRKPIFGPLEPGSA